MVSGFVGVRDQKRDQGRAMFAFPEEATEGFSEGRATHK